jgi:hypothetical protein
MLTFLNFLRLRQQSYGSKVKAEQREVTNVKVSKYGYKVIFNENKKTW